MFLGERVKSLRQQCSWLDQKKPVMFGAESVFFRNDRRETQLFSELIQHCSEFVRVYSSLSKITSQVLVPNHTLGGGAGIMCEEYRLNPFRPFRE